MESEKKVKVIFLHELKDFEEYSQFEPKFFYNSQIRIFSTTIDLDVFLQLKNIEYLTIDNYITENLAKQMDEKAYNLVKNWHKNFFKFHEISLGSLFGYELYYYFSRIIKNVQSILNVLEMESPTEIISFDNPNFIIKELNNALKYICRFKKIKFTFHSNTELNTINSDKIIRYSKKHIIKIIIFNSRKFFLEFLSKFLFFIKKNTSRKKNVLLFHLDNNPTLMKSIIQIFDLFLMGYHINKVEFIENLKNVFFKTKKANILFYSSWISTNIQRKSIRTFNQLWNNWKNVVKNPSFKKQFHYENVSLWPLINIKITNIIFLEFRKLIKWILVMKKLLKNVNIGSVIMGSDVPERYMAMSLISSELKISTLAIQHGVTGHFSGSIPSYSKYFATWGKISQKKLIEWGMSSKKIVITGCPRFDIYIHLNKNEILKKKKKKDVYKDFKIQKDKRLIVLATNYGLPRYRLNIEELDSEIIKSFEIIFDAVKNIPDIHLIIKFHYTENSTKFVRDLVNFCKLDNVSFTKDYDIINLITACDCFISGDSTTVIEAMLAEKPIVCLKFNEREYTTPYFEYNTVYKASNSHELINQIKKAFIKPVSLKNRELFLKDYLYRLDGFSTRRVMDLIKKGLEKNNDKH